jgi:hypothetical protein
MGVYLEARIVVERARKIKAPDHRSIRWIGAVLCVMPRQRDVIEFDKVMTLGLMPGAHDFNNTRAQMGANVNDHG